MFQWSSWLQPQDQETQTVGVSIERFCIMCYPNKCDVSLWICSIGQFFSVFGVLLFLTVLGRAAFVLPLSALSNYCTKSPNTKISPHHQVQTTHLLLWILDGYLTGSLHSCGLYVCISLHPNDKSQNLKPICEELMYNWIKGLDRPLIVQSTVVSFVFSYLFRILGDEGLNQVAFRGPPTLCNRKSLPIFLAT